MTLHVLMIQSTPYPPEEGIGNYVANLAHELVDRGHSVSVLTRGGLRQERTTEGGISVTRLPCPPVYPFHVDIHGVLVKRYLDDVSDRFDLVHAHTPLTPAVRGQLPLVSTVHTSVVEDVQHVRNGTVRGVLIRAMSSVASRRLVANQTDAADRVTTVSERVGRELAEHYGVEHATVVGNGVDPDCFYPDGADYDGRYVLFVGRLDYPKGVPDLLEAAKSVVRNHGIEFVVTGKGPQRDRLERLAERYGIADSVRFTGYVSRERQIYLYQNATAFALPSHYEGLPTVLLEAMACGTPVVATAVGGCPEVIDDGTNGLLVPAGEPSSIAAALDELLDDAELRDRLGRKARQTILDRYTWEAVTNAFEQEYQAALKAT